MLKQIRFAALWVVPVGLMALTAAPPAAAQVSLYHMDFKPADFNPASPGLAAGEPNVGPTNFAMPGFGWDETHGQQGRPGVFFPNTGAAPEDPGNRAFVFLFGPSGQTNSTFTSTTTPGSTFPAGGINPTLPANAGLGFSWSQHLENNAGGNPVNVRFALQTAGGNWYASNAVFPTGTVGVGSQGNYDPQSLVYNPARANWRDLTLGATPAEGVTIGSGPTAADLTGNITGIGFVAAFLAQSTVHIDFVDVGIPPVPGDVTGDRMVTLADYNIIKANFGMNVATRNLGDVTGDGVVNLFDFGQWKDNFPFPAGAGGAGAELVPEPASATLLALSLLLGTVVWRSRRRSQLP
jgi:hypothetical protein